MGILSTIALGIGINIATDKIKNAAEYFNIFHCSRLVLQQIDEAFEDALKSWSKSAVNQRTQAKLDLLIKEHYQTFVTNDNQNEIPTEFSEFLELFEFAISKRPAASSYLNSRRHESLFKELLANQKFIQGNIDEIKTITAENLEETKEIKAGVKQILSIVKTKNYVSQKEITCDKFDALEVPITFIPHIQIEENYLPRAIQNSVEKDVLEFIDLDKEYEKINLFHVIINTESDLIILEGEPGLGKSVELRMLAHTIWENASADLVPYYRNLRNFTNQDTIDSFLQTTLTEQYLNVVYILDGLDEIKEPGDFISKFNNYFTNRQNKTSRFVLSCRSNILKKLRREIEGGDTYRLKELNEEESVELFKTLTGTILNQTQENEFRKSFVIGDPFRIKLMASIFKDKGVIENDEFALWYYYIHSSLKIDEEKFVKKDVFALQVLDDSKKCATIHELMNEFLMKGETLYKILEKNKDRLEHFTASSIINTEDNNDTFYFNHRKIQECLTALFLSGLSIESIMTLCKVQGTDSIKPQLENTILLLTATLKGDAKIAELLSWIKGNAPELLFKADFNLFKIEERSSIFKEYFTEQCLKKQLWLGTHSSVNEVDLAQFSDSLDSFNFLIDIIKNNDLNHRARISAINLIEEFKSIDEALLLDTINQILNSHANLSFKSAALRLINVVSIENRVEFLRKVIDRFPDESNQEWNRSLIAILAELENIDEFFDYLHREFKWANNIIPRGENDYVHRGNSWLMMELVLRLNNEANFIELAIFYFDDYHLRTREPFRENLISKCLEFEKKSPGFIVKFLEKIQQGTKIRSQNNDEALIELIKRSNKELDAFKIIYNEESMNDIDSLTLAKITTKDTLDYFVSTIISEEVIKVKLQVYRNLIANYGYRDLAIYLEEQLKSKGVNIEDRVHTEDEVIETQRKLTQEAQENANILLDNSSIYKKIETNLGFSFSDKINNQIVRALERSFYDEKQNWFRSLGVEFDILDAALHFYNSFTFNELKAKMDGSHWIQLTALKRMHESNKVAQFKFELSENQIETIKIWIQETCNDFDFTDLIDSESFESFSVKRVPDYKFLKNFYYFFETEQFSDSFGQEFLLNSVLFYKIDEFNPFSENFAKLLERIDDKDQLKFKIIELIKSKPISSAMDKLVVYALNNDYKEVYKEIEEYLEVSSHSPGDQVFDLYLEKNMYPAFMLLERIANEPKNHKDWGALMKLSDLESKREFCVERCLSYLKSGQPEYKSNAMSVLFKLNHPDALIYFIEGLGNNPLHNIANKYRANYSVILELFLEKFNEMFNPIYQTKVVTDEFDRDWEFSENNQFFSQLITNVLKESEDIVSAYEQLQQKLKDVRKDSSDDRIVFFSNSISELLNNSYINLLSKPLSFEEALKLTNQVIN
jgi:hypothetical protein